MKGSYELSDGTKYFSKEEEDQWGKYGAANKTIRSAALDVFDIEPLAENHPIRSFDNVLFSSHVASASINAAKKLRYSAAKLVIQCHKNEKLINIVN